MSTSSLIIPDKINVGFQNRQGTYTGKLAYVIYWDGKGKLRKETSWNSWRDQKIPNKEFENKPTEGFVLNKGVGGARASYGWNTRNEYIRVYDPRDFEFEISVANLLFILRECDCSRGKGLEGEFVYAWDGTELVLLPKESVDFKESKVYTDLQVLGVKAKDLILGATYLTKKRETLIYLGRFNWHFIPGSKGYHVPTRDEIVPKCDRDGFVKKYVFVDEKGEFVYKNALADLAKVIDEQCHTDYSEWVEKYNKSPRGSKIKRLFLQEVKNVKQGKWGEETYNENSCDNEKYFWLGKDNKYDHYEISEHWEGRGYNYQTRQFDEGALKKKVSENISYLLRDGILYCNIESYYGRYSSERLMPIDRFPNINVNMKLFAEFESGAVHRVRVHGWGKE